jgi:hypothetical protein
MGDDGLIGTDLDAVSENSATAAAETPETPDIGSSELPEPSRPSKPESVRETLARSVKEARTVAEQKDKTSKTPAAKPGAAAPGQQAGDKGSTPTQGVTGQPTSGPPDAWKSRELQPLWQGLAPAVQAAITKRETDMAKGVEQLKARYQELDGAVNPYRDNIKRFGFTEAQAVDQLFKWQMALAGPDKVRAFVALMQSHGVDPATFAAALQGAQQGATPQQTSAIPPQLQTEIEGLKQKVGQFDQHFAQQTRTAAEQTVMSWAKDKPHYNAVKTLMGQLIQSGAAQPSATDPFGLDAAYQMAVHAHPEVRELVSQEQRAKEAADRKAAADKARKAGSSMRTGVPAPPALPNGAAKTNRNEAVRESIQRALAELRQ